MTEGKRRRRDQRQGSTEPLQLQQRDIDIVEAVYQHRVLKQDQIQLLFFGPKNKSGAQRRLEKLYDYEFLERVFLPVQMGQGRSPTLYVLDRAGADLLRQERDYPDLVWHSNSKDIKPLFIDHALAINDVMVAMTLACRECGFELEVWQGENQVKADYDYVRVMTEAGKREDVPIVPDSYFAIVAYGRRHNFFLELDRGQMTVKRFKNKIRGYVAYHRSGRYEKRYGTQSLRVLTVTVGAKRLEGLKAGTEEVEGQRRFWFTTLEAVKPETILTAPIWQVATEDTPRVLIEPSNEK